VGKLKFCGFLEVMFHYYIPRFLIYIHFFSKTHLLPYIIRFHGKDFHSTLINTFLIVYAENEQSILNFNSVSNFQQQAIAHLGSWLFPLIKKA